MKQAELESFKKLLEDRRVEIVNGIKNSASEISELMQSSAADEFDMASINTDSNLEQLISNKQKYELHEIDLALSKIKHGTYGVCEMCEDNISMARLKAKPTASLCITCKEISEKNII
ncbi:MAG: RNA polymerase-binding protein DksA [Campylobacter sp.]|nr:RNA polymerase-binding protein DksA [Campylobacter sp.]